MEQLTTDCLANKQDETRAFSLVFDKRQMIA